MPDLARRSAGGVRAVTGGPVLVLGGLFALRRRGVRRGRARRRAADRPHRLAPDSGCRCWPPRSSPSASNRCRAGSSARRQRWLRGGRPVAVRRAEPVLRDRRPALLDRGAPARGWRAVLAEGTGARGPRCGWWSAPTRSSRRAGPRRRRRGRAAPDAGRARPDARDPTVRPATSVLGVLRLQEHDDRPLVPGRGAPVRRPGRPGRAGAARGAAARRAGPTRRRALGPRRGAARVARSAWSRPRTPSVAGSSATSTTVPSSTSSPSR